MNKDCLGIRTGAASVHTSRTMMLRELEEVLAIVPSDSPAAGYEEAIVSANALGKPTLATRKRTATRLTELYGLDPTYTLFRILRHFWDASPAAHPMLAFLAASVRDPLLRETTAIVLAKQLGESVNAIQLTERLNELYPGRFGSSTAFATAQRLASTWTQAGFLIGKVKKVRARPIVTPVVAAFAVLLGYLGGTHGKCWIARRPNWSNLLPRPRARDGSITRRLATSWKSPFRVC